MQCFTIKTKYLGPTNTRGSRIRATSPGYKPVTVGYDHSMDYKDNCRKAAEMFLIRNAVNWTLDNEPIDDGISTHLFWIALES
jgi:hypothetical protein